MSATLLPDFGSKTGLTAIRSRDANVLVHAVNAILSLKVQRGSADEIAFADGNSILTIKQDEAGSETTITVTEVDGAPSIAADTIQFPNASVTDVGGGIARVAFGSALTVKETDGTPSDTAVTEIRVPNGTLTAVSAGIVSMAFSGVQMYRYKSQSGDYVVCRTWDGTTEGGSDVNIAKPMKLRNSITSAVIDAVTVTYSYPTTVTRVATISATTENQVIVPRYIVNDLIFAVDSSGGTAISGTLQDKIDMNVDGRAWAKAV
jgi:hypothetical protein